MASISMGEGIILAYVLCSYIPHSEQKAPELMMWLCRKKEVGQGCFLCEV